MKAMGMIVDMLKESDTRFHGIIPVLYQMAMAGVSVMGAAIAGREIAPQPESAPRRSSPRQNSPRHTVAATRDAPREGDARNTVAQARVDRAREERSQETRTRGNLHTSEDSDEDLCGLPCFTRRVRKTRVPTSFKLPDNYKKFDKMQDLEDWLADYLETTKLMGGTRATDMQSIQVHLSGAARSWMKKLPEGSIDSWETFEDFVRNFWSTCKKPASIEQLRTCKQKPDDVGITLRVTDVALSCID
jgi:hypothetical protein